jgi:hypothetical protein
MMDHMRRRLRRLVPDVTVRVVDDATALEEYLARTPPDRVRDVPLGWWDPLSDQIIIRSRIINAETVIHEGLHAAYEDAINSSPEIKRQLGSILKAVRRQVISESSGEGDVTLPYGAESIYELVSEAFSNAEFQQLLARTRMDRGNGIVRSALNAWSALIRNVKKALGLSVPDSALERIIRVTEDLDALAIPRERAPSEGAIREARAARTVAVRDLMDDQTASAALSLRRFGLVARTFDQIAQRYRGLFPARDGDALEIINRALQEQTGATNEMRKEGQKWAADFITLREKDPAQARRAAELMIEATMTGVNLIDGPANMAALLKANPHLGDLKSDRASNYQARARLPQLQNQFMGLRPETRRFILDSAAYYRTTQNEITKGLVSNILQTMTPGLDALQIGKITSQVLSGTLGADAKATLDNDALFTQLKNAQGLRAVNGLYFPLMRHGNYVVVTRAKFPANLHGGTVNGDHIEWAADKDDDARKGFKAFAQDTSHDLDIQAVDKIRRLPDGTVVAAMDVGNRPHKIVYRARVQRQGTYFFDSASQANAFSRQMKREGNHEYVGLPEQRADMVSRGDLTTPAMASIMSSINKMDVPESTKSLMSAALSQASVRLMTGNRIQQRALARRNVQGASLDIGRNMVDYAEASSRYRAKIRYMPKVRDLLAEMRKITKDSEDKERQVRGQVLAEIEKRINDQNTMSPTEPNKVVGDIMTLSFLDKLFSPAYSIVNAMQPWMVTMPVLAGEFGTMRAGAAMTRAYNSVGGLRTVGAGVANTARALRNVTKGAINTSDVVGSIRANLAKEPDAAGLTALFDELTSRGIVDDAAGFEIAGAVASGRGRWGTGLAKTDRIARQLPLAIEALNRSATAVAAYRLAKAGGMTHEQSVAHAVNTTQNTQGDYSTVNQPRLFNNPFLRPALQFKKYAQMMSALLVDMVQRAAFKSGRERRVALKQLTGIIGVQMAMAGAMGLPGLELIKVGFMVAGALGLGDGWEEEERQLRKIAEDSVGSTWAELLSKGVLSRAIPFPGGHGVDLSTRLSLADMWTFGEPKSNDREGLQSYMFQFLGGAPGSLVLDWMDGARAAGEGEWMKAATLMIPNKFVSDVAKAAKGARTGDITAGEAISQAVGFRTGRMAEEGEKIGASIARQKQLEERKKQLSRAYINAETKGELAKIKAQIIAHNKTKGVEMKQKVFTGGLDNVRRKNEERRRAIAE